jgi:uncharacterized protein YbjT (DUF2867 family)/uncharacterized protein YndB with AHSA1/START domain
VKALVTGATGYIGGRLIPRLLRAGHDVRVFVRNSAKLQGREWVDDVEVCEGDLLDPETLGPAVDGVDAAYYLVHSMCTEEDFEERDRRLATQFVETAKGRVPHVIYLGGIVPEARASSHLSSRAEVGEILRAGLPTTEFRAGPIIGSGSASFEMVRYLTQRLPIMLAPKWIENAVQPVGVRDVLRYLVKILDHAPQGIIDIGGDRLTFRRMMLEYAAIRDLPRLIIPVPILAPSLASRWVGMVTPIPNCLAGPLVEGIVDPVIADTSKAREIFPEIEPMSYHAAVELALVRVREREVRTRWSDSAEETFTLEDREGMLREIHTRTVDLPPEPIFRAFTSLGGETGWLRWNFLWKLRGILDQLVGGPGLRRGRRNPDVLIPGEAVDFWRVEEVEAPEVLRLRAEMKLPGKAWLQWEISPEKDGRSRLVQSALFAPKGFLGWVYWWSVYPAHAFVFGDMIDAIVARARAIHDESAQRL